MEGGILEVTSESQIGRALEYRLTTKGLELMPILVALAQWGNRHEPGPEGATTRIVERQTGLDIAPSPSCQPQDSRQTQGRCSGGRTGACEADNQRLNQLKSRRQAKNPSSV